MAHIGHAAAPARAPPDSTATTTKRRCSPNLAEPVDTTLGEPAEAKTAEPTGTMAERRRAHHTLVRELLAQGAG